MIQRISKQVSKSVKIIVTSLIYFKIYSFLGAMKKTSVYFDVNVSIIIILLTWEFFTPALAVGFPRETK